MIVVGTYPDGLTGGEPAGHAISRLTALLDLMLPPRLAIHLLPFYPNSGDGGFAIDDYFSVLPHLGTWQDVQALASSRRLVVDGGYNHVGIGHRWVKQFMSSPQTVAHLLHAYRTEDPSAGPVSPRGQPVLQRYEVAGEVWHIWQTFSRAAVDVRLNDREVQDEIDKHLQVLSNHGVWGVRLDAVAYYAKSLGSRIRHNPGVFQLADHIARRVEGHRMQVFAQIDCDADGCRYFEHPTQHHYVVNDFSYTAYLALAILSHDVKPLAKHLVKTSCVKHICLRTPRTHDGILLRSGLIEPWVSSWLTDTLAGHGVRVRMSSGHPYELNCSAPFLYALSSESRHLLPDWIELAVAVTGMTSGWSYFYLPFLLGYAPEDDTVADVGDDPRTLNRKPVPKSLLQDYLMSHRRMRLRELLATLASIHSETELQQQSAPAHVSVEGDHLLSLIRPGGRYRLLANFSDQRSVPLPSSVHGDLIQSNKYARGALMPAGYGIWRVR